MRKYKRYVDDPILPVPKRTLHYWKKSANCTDSSTAEMLESVTDIRSHDQTHLNQVNPPPSMCTDTTESICDLDKEDSINDFGLPVQDQPFLQEDDNDASSNHPGYLSDSSDSTDSSCTYISGSEFNESAGSDLSDNDSCSSTSDEEIEKSDDAPAASEPITYKL